MSSRASSIDRLPDDIREKLQELLRDPRVTQMEATARINAILEEGGIDERISKSAVNRYDMEMRKVGEKLRQSREVAEMWIGKLGAAPQGKLGNLINETLRTIAFDITLKLQEGELTEDNLPGVIDQLKSLALAVQRLELGATLNVKRETEIRKQALEAAAEIVERTGKAQGASAATIDALRAAIKQELAV